MINYLSPRAEKWVRAPRLACPATSWALWPSAHGCMALLDPPFLFEGWCVSGRTGSRWRSPCRPPSTACSLLPTAKKQPAKNLNRGNLKHKMTKKQWCCWKILSSQGDQGGSRWRSFATSTARKTASQKLFIIWRSSCRTASLNGMYGHRY